MAFGLRGFNLNLTSPALQRRLQQIRAQSGGFGRTSGRAEIEQAIGQDASNQFGRYISSRESRRAFDESKSRLKYGRKSLKLQKERGLLSHLHNMGMLGIQQRQLKNQQDDAFMHSLFGLGGMGFGLYQDRQARARDAIYQQKQQDQLDMMNQWMRHQRGDYGMNPGRT